VVSVTLAPESAQATKGFIDSADGTRLAYRSWPAAGSKITFAVVHGLGEHSGRYERFARGMARHGMATYAVDLRGHGESAGQRGHVDSWSQWVDDASAFVTQVESQTTGEVVPVGHSFGGAVMLSTVRSGKVKHARRFVLSSPALKLKAKVPAWKTSLGKVMANVAPRLAMENEVDAGTVSRIPEVVAAYRADPLVHGKISSRLFMEWQRAARENIEHAGDIRIPFLILAGTADRLIDFEGSRRLHERAPAMSELRLLEGRYHEPFNDLGDEEVFALIAEWLRK
jgi:alpha-beta hydrolase superfamily lysophospholipase